MLQVILAFQFGMQQFILKKQQLREGCWHEASCLCCGEPEVAHARALFRSGKCSAMGQAVDQTACAGSREVNGGWRSLQDQRWAGDLWICGLFANCLGLRDQGGGGSTRGSSEVTEVYARSPVSLVTWIERSLGLKGVKIIVRTVNQSSLSGSLCPAIVCKSCADLGRSRGRRSRRGSSRDD